MNQIHPSRSARLMPSLRFAAMAVFLCGLLPCGIPAGGSASAADDQHASGEHGEHGDHGDHGEHGHLPEIGHNPPAGTTQKDFESPAWFQTDLAVWSFAVFLGLFGLLTKFAWKPIMEGLEKREQGIADTIAATQAANEDARRMLASYERRLAEATDEVRGMLEEARRDADATRQTIVAEARKAAEEEKARPVTKSGSRGMKRSPRLPIGQGTWPSRSQASFSVKSSAVMTRPGSSAIRWRVWARTRA